MKRRAWTLVVTAILSTACDQRPPVRTPALQRTHKPAGRVLRVCADPNNLPFTNRKLEGFENRIADLIAEDLGARVEYTWFAQRRGFVRNTLRAGKCDLILGIPSSFELAQPTRPYYRSTYVFVWRSDRPYDIRSFDDPRLRTLKIGVHLVGDDGSNTPPAHALAKRGIVENVRGYTLYGDYRDESPPARLIEAVAKGDIDVAIAWGPLAGYYARKQNVFLDIVPVSPHIDLPFLPFVFDIAAGVRRGEDAFRAEIDTILEKRASEITRILDDFGVPQIGRKKIADIRVMIADAGSPSFLAGARMGAEEAKRTASLFKKQFEIVKSETDVFAIIRGDGTVQEMASGKTYRLREISPAGVAWHPDLQRYGAGELNERFVKATGRQMDAEAWTGWLAMKVVVEAALRNRSIGSIRVDGHKGVPLRFGSDGVLQQPLYRVSSNGQLIDG